MAIADFANDEGEAFPSVETLAKKAAISERAARIAIRELEALGELQTSMNAGPRGANLYQLSIKGEESAPLNNLPPEESDREGGRKQQGGGQKTTEKGEESAPKPSLTVREPSVNRQGQTRKWPSLADVKVSASNIGVPDNIAEIFWNEMESSGWVDKQNRPVRQWQNALAAYGGKWKANDARSNAAKGQQPKAKTASTELQKKYGW